MKCYIRRVGGQGRLADRLNRRFASVEKARAELKDWLREANRKRKAAGQRPYKVSEDFKFFLIKPAKSKRRSARN